MDFQAKPLLLRTLMLDIKVHLFDSCKSKRSIFGWVLLFKVVLTVVHEEMQDLPNEASGLSRVYTCPSLLFIVCLLQFPILIWLPPSVHITISGSRCF